MNNNLVPDFLGIGATKSGTSWLYVVLKEHPDIWMPFVKELHYFDRSIDYPSPSFLASDRLLKRIIGREKHNKHFRGLLAMALKRNICKPNWGQLCWDTKFYLGNYNDQWYMSLFDQGKHKIKGEITPGYSLLELPDVKHIHKIMPNVKVIYFLRNPVDRMWSGLRYTNRADLPFNKIKEIVDRKGRNLRGNYLRTISTWRTYFKENQFFIGFYDEIQQNPRSLLLRLFNFLGVESEEKHISQSAYHRVNTSKPKEIPEKLKVFLTMKYFAQIKELSKLVGGYSKNWLEVAEATLRDAGQDALVK